MIIGSNCPKLGIKTGKISPGAGCNPRQEQGMKLSPSPTCQMLGCMMFRPPEGHPRYTSIGDVMGMKLGKGSPGRIQRAKQSVLVLFITVFFLILPTIGELAVICIFGLTETLKAALEFTLQE